MENNLDDILVDSPVEKKPQAKRKILIVFALILLVVAVGLVAFFVLNQEEKREIEISHTELERMVNPQEAQSSPKTDDLDKLIAEIKAKDSQNATKEQKEAKTEIKQETKTVEEKSKMQDKTAQNASPSKEEPKRVMLEEVMKKMEQREQEVEPKVEKQQIKPKAQKQEEQKKQGMQKKQEIKPKQDRMKQDPKRAAQAFDALQDKVPSGFYLQVGVFQNKPNEGFLQKISAFKHEIEKVNRNGNVVNRYLIGPFMTRGEAQAQIKAVQKIVPKPVLVEIK